MFQFKTPSKNPCAYHTSFIPPKGYTNWCTGDLRFMVNDHNQVSTISPPKSPSAPLLNRYDHRHLSPENRTQVIARARWKLMEMVKNMPETSHELSLKDMVAHHEEEIVRANMNNEKAVVRKNVSNENKGVLLKIGFPRVSSRSKKSNRFSGRYGSGMHVCKKTEGVKSCEEDDWRKKTLGGSADSGGGRSCRCSSSGSSCNTGKSCGSDPSCRSCSTGKSCSSNNTCRSCNKDRKSSVARTCCWTMFPFQRKHSS